MENTHNSLAGKLLQKLTLKGLGRLLWFRVDSGIENRLVKEVAVERVRNIFVGNEPYVEGTALYTAMAKLLKRLHPMTRLIEKKAGKTNPLLSDIDAFVLSMIGDTKQRDYETTIQINRG